MKKLLLILLILPLFSYGQLTKSELYKINARDIKASGAYSSLKLGKLIDSLVLSLALDGGGGGSSYTGNTPTTVTVGGLASGTDISTYSTSDVLSAIVAPFVGPQFNSFAVSGLSNTLPVGTTISGTKTFTWATTANSATITTIDIFDNIASSNLVTGLSNTGSTSHSVTTNQLNGDGASQSWKAIGHYTGGGGGTFTSSNFVSTGRYDAYYGPASASVTNSSTVKALPNDHFPQLSGNSFTMQTGTTLTKFIICLPPGYALVSVLDVENSNANITTSFIAQSNINVLDAGSTNRSFSIYEYNAGSAYSPQHHFTILTN